jgi:hypothetical protein
LVGGLHVLLFLSAADPADVRADPITAAVWAEICARRALRSGDEVLLQRFMIDRMAGPAPSTTSDLAAMRAITLVASHPRLSWDTIATPAPDLWGPKYAVLGFERVPQAGPMVGDLSFGLFVRDTARFHDMHDPLRPPPDDPVHELSRFEFEAAVRAALRDVLRVDVLARNPLLGTRCARGAGGGPDGVRSVITAAADTLREHPRDAKLYRALDRTYLRPAPTQERAAELLGLPFSTYRRHLAQGIARIVDALWERETSRN